MSLMGHPCHKVRNGIHGQGRPDTENRNKNSRKEECQTTEPVHVKRDLIIGHLILRMLLPEDADIELQHVGTGETAGDEEDPLNHGIHHREAVESDFPHMLRHLHNALMHQRFTHIAGEEGNAHETEHAHEEGKMEKRSPPAKAAYIVEVQFVQIHVNDTR